MRTDRRAPLLRLRLLPCGVRWSRRTARSNQLRAIPLRRCSQPRHPRQEVGSPMRFLAPRVSGAIHNCVRWRRRRADHSWPISFGRRTGSAPAVIATWPGSSKSRRRPWDSLNTLRSFAAGRGGGRLSPSRTHRRFRHLPPRFSWSGGRTVCGGATEGLWPRLLGFGPANEPCRVIWRPRHGFYAQGRSKSTSRYCLGLFTSLTRFVCAVRFCDTDKAP
jgi:hypothetical protein